MTSLEKVIWLMDSYLEMAIHESQIAEHLLGNHREILALVNDEGCLLVLHEQDLQDVSEVGKETVDELCRDVIVFQAFDMENMRRLSFNQLFEALELILVFP